MLAAAAVCPHPPLLVPEAVGAAAPGRGAPGGPADEPDRADPADLAELGALLAACDAAVNGLADAAADAVVVVGTGPATAAYDGGAAGSLREYGVDYSVGTGEPVLPLSLTIGSVLLRRAGMDLGQAALQAVARGASVAECLRLGAGIARRARRVAVLAMGDGPARRAVGAEGAADPGVERYHAEVAAALEAADPARLARLPPELDDELLVAGRAAWQVLAGAAEGRRLRGRLRCSVTRYEVSYLVASWDVLG